MKEVLLNFISCPICEGDFDLKKEKLQGEEVIKGSLVCSNSHRFEITNGVPRLLPEDDNKDKKQTKDSFSSKWKMVPDFGHEEKSRNFGHKFTLERFGFGGEVSNLASFLSDKKFILDAGCGLGREAKLYAENTKGLVFGVDISESVDIAFQHIGNLSNVHLLQADLTRLPFRKNFFDYITSNGVLHHTPDTEKTFKYLTTLLREGGEIAAYIYKKKGPIREFCDDYLREYATNLSVEECMKFSKAITAFGKSLSDLKIEFVVPEDIPILSIKAGKYDLQRFIFYNVIKCYWSDELDYDSNVITNFDWYHPKHAHRHTPEEVKQWYIDQGLEVVHTDIIEAAVTIRGKKY